MFRTAIDIAGGMAAAVLAVCLGLVLGGAELPASSSTSMSTSVNREAKADMLPVNPAAAPKANRISIIEVIGVSDAAVVYRDREGQLLFKTDPLSNTTVVVKNTVLPEVTVRESENEEVMPVPVESFKKPAAVREVPNTFTPSSVERKIPEGCESAFSTFTVPSQKNKAGRCLSSLDDARKFSAVN